MITKDILKKYTEPHRFYHNLAHIGYMIQAIDRTKDYLDFELTTRDREILMEAIIYHDVIYNINNEDGISNEQKSADYYAEHALIFEQQVYDMILASEHHFTDKEYDELTSYFLDLDLANIAIGTYEEMDHTDKLLIKEYETSFHRNEVLKGRKKFVLESMKPKARLRAIKNQTINEQFQTNIDYLAYLYRE